MLPVDACAALGFPMKLARNVVLTAALLAMSMAVILLFVTPPAACPGWHLRDAGHTSLWLMLAGWSGLLLTFASFIVLRWDWCIKKFLEMETKADPQFLVPVSFVLTQMCIFSAAWAQLPLFFIFSCATNWATLD